MDVKPIELDNTRSSTPVFQNISTFSDVVLTKKHLLFCNIDVKYSCSSKLTVFLELRSRETVHFSEQIMSADKYPCIFSPQIKAIVYILPNFQNRSCCGKYLKDNKLNSLHLARKYARRFVLGHYLFLEAHSFPRATL